MGLPAKCSFFLSTEASRQRGTYRVKGNPYRLKGKIVKKRHTGNVIREIKKATEGMERREKLEYIFSYYWLQIGAVFFGIAFGIYFLSHVLFSVRDNWIYVTFVNVLGSDAGVERLKTDFSDHAGYDQHEKNVVFNANCYFNAAIAGGTNNNYFQAFVAMVEAGDLDAVISSAENIEAVGASGRLKNLSAEDMKAQFSEYTDRFVYCRPIDEEYSTDEVPVGIDISDSRIVTEYGIYTGDCVLGVGAYTENVQEVLRFLEYISS